MKNMTKDFEKSVSSITKIDVHKTVYFFGVFFTKIDLYFLYVGIFYYSYFSDKI